jgi:DNA-binding MarR family transcriptional regulator
VNENTRELYAMIVQVRTCFNLLKTRTEQLLEDLEINPSMRAVLESLYRKDLQTVPEIAKGKGVSRQHIQMIMNSLTEDGFVQQVDNPQHKRSPQFQLQEAGRSIFEETQRREAEPIGQLAQALPLENLPETIGLLEKLNTELTQQIEKGSKN